MGSGDTETIDYRDALKMVLDSVLTLRILPRITCAIPFIPKRMQLLAQATKAIQALHDGDAE